MGFHPSLTYTRLFVREHENRAHYLEMNPGLDLMRAQNRISKQKAGRTWCRQGCRPEVASPGSERPWATQWGETGLGGAELRLGHISNSCFFGAMSRTDFILPVLTLHEATAGGQGRDREQQACWFFFWSI